MNLGPIPRRAIADYADEYDFGDEMKDDLIFVVRKLDNDYLAREAKKNKGGKGKK